MTSVFIFTRGDDGHRQSYNATFVDIIKKAGLRPALIRDKAFLSLFRGSVFFTMIEEDMLSFLYTVMLGALVPRPVVGLMFRPAECFQSRWKSRIKRWLFLLIRRLSWVKVVTILPFSVDPRFAKIADDWVFDPQMWDVHLTPATPLSLTDLSHDIRNRAGDRRVAITIGRQSRLKGFDYFCRVWASSDELRRKFLFVAAGRVERALAADADVFQENGGFLVDRSLSDDEIRELYDVADIVWSCYAPNYNQASGIGGRAFQYGVPLIVRAESYLSSMMRDMSHPTVELDYATPSASAGRIIEAVQTSLARAASGESDKLELERRSRAMLDRFNQVVVSALAGR